LVIEGFKKTEATSTTAPAKKVVDAVKRMFELGDTAFNNPAHHGEPEFRATMVRAGYEEAGTSPSEAFAKGRRLTGLS
jgi:hypothetical protein